MSRARTFAPSPMYLADAPPRGGSILFGGLVYAVIALVGFGFGVWVGSQKPKTVEVVRTPTPAPEPTPEPKTNAPAPEPKKPEPKPKKPEPTAEPKKTEPKKVEPKKTEPMPEPKKPEEPKKTEAVATKLTFEKDIRPILRANCLNCHGDPTVKGGLDVRTLDKIKQGGDGGAGLVAGDPDKSLLWDRIQDNSMPPKDSKKMLTADEKKAIKEWIAGGAK
ncbi:MAG: hypothetical protein K2P78_05095 [Gemmataceae bacterium]|nr:hypothetical protein [Gemmataceae bacterium]